MTKSKRIVRRYYERHRTRTKVFGESMTDQSLANETNINTIVARYDRTGVIPPAKQQGVYADVTHLQQDLTESLNSSAETIGKADTFMAEVDRKTKKAKQEKQIDLEDQIKTLTAQNEILNKRKPAEPTEHVNNAN